jgi:hypothetical protein
VEEDTYINIRQNWPVSCILLTCVQWISVSFLPKGSQFCSVLLRLAWLFRKPLKILYPGIFLIGIVGGGVQLGPFGTVATNRPIVPASPGWLWGWRNWWNDDWQGEPKYSEETCPRAALSTTNRTCCPDEKPGRHGGKPAINRLSYVTALPGY